MLSHWENEETTANTIGPNAKIVLEDLENYEKFDQLFIPKITLGIGGDGAVYSYQHMLSKVMIVVKVPKDGALLTRETLMNEIDSLKTIGRHDHIVTMLTYSEKHTPLAPAIFLDLCDLGDLYIYRRQWCNQERAKGRPERPSEITIWKLLKDMSLGLDFIHNGHKIRYVHNDLKPGNILVTSPKDWNKADGVPPEPIFKITDFARLTPFPTPPRGKPCGWRGTPEFAPPFNEQLAPILPSADIWSLGATIQAFALGIHPIQSRQAFLLSRKAQGMNFPDIREGDPWKSNYWRVRIPTVYRPLNASQWEFETKYDLPVLPRDYRPYSYTLNVHYSALWGENIRTRITSRDLVKYVVPMIDEDVVIAKSRAEAEECFGQTRNRQEKLIAGEAARVAPNVGVEKVRGAPNYEGKGWGMSIS